MNRDEHTRPVRLKDGAGDIARLRGKEERQERAFQQLGRRMIRRARRQEFIEGVRILFRGCRRWLRYD